MQEVTVLGVTLSPWMFVPVIYFIWLTVFFILKKVLFNRVKAFASKTKNRVDDIIVEALDIPLTLVIFISGAFLIEKMLPLDGDLEFAKYFGIALRVTSVVAVIMFLDTLFKNLIRIYSTKFDILKTSGGIAQGVVRGIVYGIGLLILVDSFGISITPILASLGVGSLAIALALQPTLENFFAGIQIVIDKPIKVGQFVKLDSGEGGYIAKIGWRSTWLRMLQNNVVVIPNKVLVDSKVLNYYYPDQELAVLVQVGVHYESDLEHVERVTMEVGKETMKTAKGGVPEFNPFIRYHTFDDFSINFTVILRAKEFVDNYLVKHEFIKALHKRYAQEDINIPYPIRAINHSQEKSE